MHGPGRHGPTSRSCGARRVQLFWATVRSNPVFRFLPFPFMVSGENMSTILAGSRKANLVQERGNELMVKFGVVGYGYWGPNVVRNLDRLDEAKVVAVCDSSAS